MFVTTLEHWNLLAICSSRIINLFDTNSSHWSRCIIDSEVLPQLMSQESGCNGNGKQIWVNETDYRRFHKLFSNFSCTLKSCESKMFSVNHFLRDKKNVSFEKKKDFFCSRAQFAVEKSKTLASNLSAFPSRYCYQMNLWINKVDETREWILQLENPHKTWMLVSALHLSDSLRSHGLCDAGNIVIPVEHYGIVLIKAMIKSAIYHDFILQD